jgi:putative transposase
VILYRNRYRIESARLKGWDYASHGWYFVTVCARNRECFFGEVMGGRMRLSEIGDVARRYWEEIPHHSGNVRLDAFVVMPSHVHGIIIIEGVGTGPCRDVACNVSTAGATITTPSDMSPKSGSLSAILRSYKSAVTRWCRANGHPSFAWQPRFYDHIIRNQTALKNIREYIVSNPARWEMDRDNPANLRGGR